MELARFGEFLLARLAGVIRNPFFYAMTWLYRVLVAAATIYSYEADVAHAWSLLFLIPVVFLAAYEATRTYYSPVATTDEMTEKGAKEKTVKVLLVAWLAYCVFNICFWTPEQSRVLIARTCLDQQISADSNGTIVGFQVNVPLQCYGAALELPSELESSWDDSRPLFYVFGTLDSPIKQQYGYFLHCRSLLGSIKGILTVREMSRSSSRSLNLEYKHICGTPNHPSVFQYLVWLIPLFLVMTVCLSKPRGGAAYSAVGAAC